MRLARVVVRIPIDDREALDRLRGRYFEETKRGMSRAAVVRALVRLALVGSEARMATDVLHDPEITATAPRARRAKPSG